MDSIVEILASIDHDNRTVTVTRDESPSVGNPAPYTSVRVDGIYIGHVSGTRREENGEFTVTLRVVNGYDRITLTGTGGTFADAVASRAAEILAYYRREYPLAK